MFWVFLASPVSLNIFLYKWALALEARWDSGSTSSTSREDSRAGGGCAVRGHVWDRGHLIWRFGFAGNKNPKSKVNS